MWWIIIGAVIALIVLVVLLVIFTGKTNILETELLNCESKGGRCVEDTFGGLDCYEVCDKEFNGARRSSSTFTCSKVEDKERCCCLGVGDSQGTGDDSE